ncbi:hypothetical protein AB835_10025 [Candidatus Endobugula sertula]|uniref:Uncharacterized protein n=1 Tax=Candidatus Endobugula sertula TaxID=62101 RepID=A0A1D2QNS2_9GAMM|nr:hypothetical protein AB835_10025 [Candidatus Endobugula sertula]
MYKNSCVLVSMLLTLSVSFFVHSATDEEMVKWTFATYVNAVTNDKGILAYSSVDKNTRDYYDYVYKVSMDLSNENFSSISILDKIHILTVRYMISEDKLSKMNGEKLFIYAVNNGWVDKSRLLGISIGNVHIKEDFASGQVIVGGQPMPLNCHFYKEQGEWKIDVNIIAKWGESLFIQQQKLSGLSEDEFVFQVLKEMSRGKFNIDSARSPLKV